MKYRFVDTKLLYRHSQIILICIYINGYETEETSEAPRGCFSDQEATTRKRKTYSYETRLSPDANANQFFRIFGKEKPYVIGPVFFSGKKGSSASTHSTPSF
jgi:hypothetical protein